MLVGSYLFVRIMKDGSDSRFDDIKKSKPSLIGAFMIQAAWVSLCLFPVMAINAIPSASLALLPKLMLTDLFGFALYAGGLGFEVVADRQKTKWVEDKKKKLHDEQFITSGLWAKSRHPNYFGESTLWTGIAIASAGVLMSNPAQAAIGLSSMGLGKAVGALMAGVSPAFITFLLLKVCQSLSMAHSLPLFLTMFPDLRSTAQ
jgi:steroid 5-alpha reductase family enzyme